MTILPTLAVSMADLDWLAMIALAILCPLMIAAWSGYCAARRIYVVRIARLLAQREELIQQRIDLQDDLADANVALDTARDHRARFHRLYLQECARVADLQQQLAARHTHLQGGTHQ